MVACKINTCCYVRGVRYVDGVGCGVAQNARVAIIREECIAAIVSEVGADTMLAGSSILYPI